MFPSTSLPQCVTCVRVISPSPILSLPLPSPLSSPLPPDANITNSAPWAGFNSTYSEDALLGMSVPCVCVPYLCAPCLCAPCLCVPSRVRHSTAPSFAELFSYTPPAEPTDPLFLTLGTSFYNLQTQIYGTDVSPCLRCCLHVDSTLCPDCIDRSTSTMRTRTMVSA